jgi:hypothetical protein
MLRPLVVYIATHCSAPHVAMLNSRCWAKTLAALPASTDVVFYITHPRCAEACRIPAAFKPAAVVCGASRQAEFPDEVVRKQAAAIDAIRAPRAVDVLRRYEWIMRLNPDTVVTDVRRVLALRRPHYDAVVAMCFGVNMSPRLRAHTDFALFRSSLLGRHEPQDRNAERDFTAMLAQTDRVYTMWKNPTGVCRINYAGVVVHSHDGPGQCV